MKPLMMVTDRDPRIREELKRCLTARGWDVLVAADALQCLELLQNHEPHLLVLDPELLWGGGEGVLDWLAAQEPLPRLTVLVTNGHHIPLSRRNWRSLVSARLERPAGRNDLLQLVDLLEQEAWKWQADHQPKSLTCKERQPGTDVMAQPRA